MIVRYQVLRYSVNNNRHCLFYQAVLAELVRIGQTANQLPFPVAVHRHYAAGCCNGRRGAAVIGAKAALPGIVRRVART